MRGEKQQETKIGNVGDQRSFLLTCERGYTCLFFFYLSEKPDLRSAAGCLEHTLDSQGRKSQSLHTITGMWRLGVDGFWHIDSQTYERTDGHKFVRSNKSHSPQGASAVLPFHQLSYFIKYGQ